MTVEKSPTYVGFHKESGLWAFSPSLISNVDFMWDISHWEFKQIQELMELPDDKARIIYLMAELGLPLDNRENLSELKGE